MVSREIFMCARVKHSSDAQFKDKQRLSLSVVVARSKEVDFEHQDVS
jgi:hypothetical protein